MPESSVSFVGVRAANSTALIVGFTVTVPTIPGVSVQDRVRAINALLAQRLTALLQSQTRAPNLRRVVALPPVILRTTVVPAPSPTPSPVRTFRINRAGSPTAIPIVRGGPSSSPGSGSSPSGPASVPSPPPRSGSGSRPRPGPGPGPGSSSGGGGGSTGSSAPSPWGWQQSASVQPSRSRSSRPSTAQPSTWPTLSPTQLPSPPPVLAPSAGSSSSSSGAGSSGGSGGVPVATIAGVVAGALVILAAAAIFIQMRAKARDRRDKERLSYSDLYGLAGGDGFQPHVAQPLHAIEMRSTKRPSFAAPTPRQQQQQHPLAHGRPSRSSIRLSISAGPNIAAPSPSRTSRSSFKLEPGQALSPSTAGGRPSLTTGRQSFTKGHGL